MMSLIFRLRDPACNAIALAYFVSVSKTLASPTFILFRPTDIDIVNLASSIPPNTRKTILDAWNAYHLLPLSEEACDATTFITEWGRYRYLRGPQGFKASGDAYTKAYYDLTMDIPRKVQCVDDTLLWDNDIEESFWHTIDYITHCSQNGVVFNPTKFRFSQTEIDFAGFHVTKDGIKPAKSLLDAISSFPKPTNIRDARSWFGLVNQVAFGLSSSKAMQPFRDLLKPGMWYWDEPLDRAFEDSKAAILAMVRDGIHTYELNRLTCLCTDWSKEGTRLHVITETLQMLNAKGTILLQ